MLSGGGVINKLIDKLPIELHLPGYKYCGPGTKLKDKLEKGVEGKNQLDNFCKSHDIAYSESKDLKSRHIADKILAEQAWSRFKSKDSSFGEKASAWLVTNIMKTKIKTGSGVKTNKRKCKGGNILIAKKKKNQKKKNNKHLKNKKRTLLLPKSGGVIPIAAIPAIIGVVSALAHGGSSIVNSINNFKLAKKHLAETVRHNKELEQKSKKGLGFYLKPYQKEKQ